MDNTKEKSFDELTDKYGYIKGSLIYTGMEEKEVVVMSEEDADAAYEALIYFAI